MLTQLAKHPLPGERPLDETQIHFVDSFDKVLEFREWVSNSRGRTVLAIDTETAGLDPYAPEARIRLTQFSDENVGWVINCEKYAGIAREVIETYNDTPIVFHNLAFDYMYMSVVWPDLKFPWHLAHDTMLYCRIHDNEALAGLKVIGKRLFGELAVAGQDALDQSMKLNGWTWNTVPMSSPAYTIYSGVDVLLTARLYRRLQHIHSGPYAHIARLEMDSLRIACNMTMKGIHVDRAYCVEQRDKLRSYVEQVNDVLKNHMGINIRSNPALAAYFQSAGATLTKKTKTGAWSMDKETLQGLAAEGFEVANSILEMRKADKLASTYFDNLLDFSDNPEALIHPQINTVEARTGRMSISKPSMQNMPSKDSLVRGAFLPPPGQSIISCDFGQIELRLTAHISQDPALLAALRECDATGDDIFTRIGRDLYGPTFQKSDKRRGFIKNVIYGSTYGAGVPTMARSAKVPVATMQPIADDIFRRFVGIKGIQQKYTREAERNRADNGRPFITTPSGRRLFVDPDRMYSAANYAVQGLAADEMKRALIRLDNAGLGQYLQLPIHDEVVMSVPNEDVADVMPMVKDVMTIEPEMGYSLQIPADPEGPWDRWRAK